MRVPQYGETYFYITDDKKVVSRRNNLQDVDVNNVIKGNYYFTENKARLAALLAWLSSEEKEV